MKVANALAQAKLNGDNQSVIAIERQLAVQRGVTAELRNTSPPLAAALEKQILIELSLKRQQAQQEQLRAIGEQVGQTIADTFLAGAKAGDSFEATMRKVVAQLIEMAAQLYIIKPLIASMGNAFAGSGGSGGGPLIGMLASLIPAFADGGVVGPSASGSIVRVGEAGQSEAILPLARGSNGQLGVSMRGGNDNSGGGSPVNVVINVAGDATDATVAKMQGVAKMVAEQVVAARAKGIISAGVQATRNEIVRDPAFLRRA